MSLLTIGKADARYPERLRHRLGADAPSRVTCVGNSDLLGLPKTALFCSARCPGNVILAAHDQAARWRDEGHCIISGFHSPVEKGCMQVLLRGRQPIIVCPARAIDRMRVPTELRGPMEEGRLLLLSPFAASDRRVRKELARQRNRFVGALADEIVFAHIHPGGHLDELRQMVSAWDAPNRQVDDNNSRVSG